MTDEERCIHRLIICLDEIAVGQAGDVADIVSAIDDLIQVRIEKAMENKD